MTGNLLGITKLNATAIVLAGGANSRMGGADKAQLPVEGGCLIELVLAPLVELFEQVVVVSNGDRLYDYPGVELVHDRQSGQGPLMGLYSGLVSSGNDLNFVKACDMPFISEPLVRFMMAHSGGFEVVVPLLGGFCEPLTAIYAKSAMPHIEKSLAENRRKMVSFYPYANVYRISENQVRSLDPQMRSFVNINTPTEFSKYNPNGQQHYYQNTACSRPR